MAIASREACILFADVVGSTRLYEKLGDAEAKHAIERCLKRVGRAVEATGGRVVKTIGDEVMAVLPDAAAAMKASTDMQERVTALPPVSGIQLAIRVGFHAGAVIEEGGDYFGDTVNIAARLAALARPNQILAGGASLDGVSPLLRQATRTLEPVSVKGKRDPVPVSEVIWQADADLTMLSVPPAPTSAPGVRLKLVYRASVVELGPERESALLGRDLRCDLVIADPKASRQHARIERRGDRFVLVDQSTNGTWVGFAGEPEVKLQREEIILRGSGRISFGQAGGEIVVFDPG